LFDHIIIWELDRQERSPEQMRQMSVDIAFLRAEGVVLDAETKARSASHSRAVNPSTLSGIKQTSWCHSKRRWSNVPWQDIVQFRKDGDNIERLRRLRVWLQKQSVSGSPPSLIKEELEFLLDDYRKYMKVLHKKHGTTILEAIFVAAPEAAVHALDAKFGTALQTLLDIRRHELKVTQGEL
jgi:hypothetical protein